MKRLLTLTLILISFKVIAPCVTFIKIKKINILSENKILEYIISHENTPYNPIFHSDGFNHNTIGYGHLLQANDTIVYLSQKEAFKLLKNDWNKNKEYVLFHFKGLNENQINALTHLAFCKGIGTVLKSRVVSHNSIDSTILFSLTKGANFNKLRMFEYKLFNKF